MGQIWKRTASNDTERYRAGFQPLPSSHGVWDTDCGGILASTFILPWDALRALLNKVWPWNGASDAIFVTDLIHSVFKTSDHRAIPVPVLRAYFPMELRSGWRQHQRGDRDKVDTLHLPASLLLNAPGVAPLPTCTIPFPSHRDCRDGGSFGLSPAAGRAPAGRGWMGLGEAGGGERVTHAASTGRRKHNSLSCYGRHTPVAAPIWCKTTGFAHPLWKEAIWGEHGEQREQWRGCHCWRRGKSPLVVMETEHIIRQTKTSGPSRKS